MGHNLKANTEGRLEICLEGQWGSICANYWDSLDAQVACRQLGYAPTGNYYSCTFIISIHVTLVFFLDIQDPHLSHTMGTLINLVLFILMMSIVLVLRLLYCNALTILFTATVLITTLLV